MVVYYLVGRKIKLIFFRNNEHPTLNLFISIALGYIFVNSGLAILGNFSLFYPLIIWLYIGVILVFAFYPFYDLENVRESIFRFSHLIKILANKKMWIFLGTFLFVAIAFLRLIPPEIGEDAIGYHTSNPHLFLKNHTMMLTPTSSSVALLTPQLGEMSYVLSEFIGIIDSARYIHFAFYFLVVFLLMLMYPYAAIFFVTAPVVIQVSSKANVDFQWIFCWLLLIFLITRNRLRRTKNVILMGILFGGVLASKIWTIAFFPLFVLYLLISYRKLSSLHKLSIIITFSLSALLVDSVWLLRSYIVIGNPVFPAFSTIETLEGISGELSMNNIIGFNSLMFHIKNISVFSPLFFLAILAFIFTRKESLKFLSKRNLSLLFGLLILEYLFIRYHFGRYLLGLYSLAILFFSESVKLAISKFNLYKIIFISIFIVMFAYYSINTLLILPYGFGWADKNKYLTRILSRDNSSYYNFDKRFDKWISKKDKVATYETFGFYYANFDYIDINYIFDKDNRSFEQLRRRGITKIFIKGGKMEWFCEKLRVTDCHDSNYQLLAQYSPDPKYLYLVKNIKK